MPDHDRAILGEATPVYIYWPRARERLKTYNPAARLILLLRHPTFRAFSHWRIEISRSNETLPFEDCISDEGRARVTTAPRGVHRVHSYIERSLYADQLRRLYALFPREQVLVQRTDHLWACPDATLDAIAKFLDFVEPLRSNGYVTPYESDSSLPMQYANHTRLDALFRQDIARSQ